MSVQIADGIPERFQSPVQIMKPAVKRLFQRAVRIDRVNEEIRAAVGKRGESTQKKLLIRLRRSVVVQTDAAGGHEFKRRNARVSRKRLDRETLLSPASVEISGSVIGRRRDPAGLSQIPAVQNRGKLMRYCDAGLRPAHKIRQFLRKFRQGTFTEPLKADPFR